MGCIPGFLRGSFAGGLGAVMIVDYAASNVAARQATVGIEIDHELQLVWKEGEQR